MRCRRERLKVGRREASAELHPRGKVRFSGLTGQKAELQKRIALQDMMDESGYRVLIILEK